MARFQGATYFSMKGGLNTEASPLNIPQSDATDILNVDINIDGSIERRRGMDIFSNGLDPNKNDYGTAIDLPTIVEFNPTDDLGNLRRHVVIQFGDSFFIYDYDSPETLTELNDPKQVIASTGIAGTKTRFLADQNKLFIVNKNLNFAYLDYNSATDTFTLEDAPVSYRKISGSSAPITVLDTGWDTGCLAGSRVWLAGTSTSANTLYFSQTIVDGESFNKMYQEADPFSALDNILVDTDGGSIQLTGAEKIIALAPLGAGVIVFASNGVWSIGGQDGFRPTNYSINKISDVGLIGTDAWYAVEQQLVFFGKTNIYTVLLGTSIDTPEVQAIGDKITTFYNNIPLYNRKAGKAIYVSDLKKLYFYTNFDKYEWHKLSSEGVHYRDVLIMDVRLNAWTTYKLADDSVGEKLHIADALILDNGMPLMRSVTDGGDFVFDGAEVVEAQSTVDTGATYNTGVLFIEKYTITGLPPFGEDKINFRVYLGEMRSTGVVDFPSSQQYTESYTSSITIAHQLFGDVAYKKFAPYMIPIFKRVETNATVEATPGGCLYRIDWDWSINNNSKKFGELKQAYFPYKVTKNNFSGVDPGYDIVTSKLKIRGRGEVFRLHFESDGDKDFKLYGWQIMMYAKGRV